MDIIGEIFDIQRCSYVDGPGIRTVVFFKGCNLNCVWCHNPESKSKDRQHMYFKNRCTDCGKCRGICPHGAINNDLSIDTNKCILCGKCVLVCRNDARKICGYEDNSDEIMRKIVKDKQYYRNSGGGITFSGGECMLQIDFLKELLIQCRNEDLHTAVDTAGNVPWERFEAILPYTDLFLYDLKHTDNEIHKNGTGVSNRLILANLEHLLEQFPEKVIIRIPLIPNFNDDKQSLSGFRNWLSTHNAPKQIEPLIYHKLGEHKSEALGEIPFCVTPPASEKFERIKKYLLNISEEL